MATVADAYVLTVVAEGDAITGGQQRGFILAKAYTLWKSDLECIYI
jgi:hypothetical protein